MEEKDYTNNIIILLQQYLFSNTLKKLSYIQFTTIRGKDKHADLTGSRF